MVANNIQITRHKGVLYLYDNTNENNRQLIEQLTDKRRNNDHIMPWMRKHLTDTAYAAMAHCGDYLVMLEDDTGEHRKLDVGYFCRQRLCSGCAWRSAVESARCVASISAALVENKRVMLMVTLTVPNVSADKLRETIQHIGRSWSRLCKRKGYAAWSDNVRKIEVTYNAQTDTYHPHMHCIVYVPRSYFARSYISQQQLLQDWRAATRQPEITQVDIRRCRDKGTTNAILEVAKYSAKASDYGRSEKVCDTMYTALHHTRTMTYAGRAKELRNDYVAGRLAAYEELDTVRYTQRVVYVWQRTADAYAEHSRQAYNMDDAELERLQRDEARLTAYALNKAQRAENWQEWLAVDWARIRPDEWERIEVVD